MKIVMRLCWVLFFIPLFASAGKVEYGVIRDFQWDEDMFAASGRDAGLYLLSTSSGFPACEIQEGYFGGVLVFRSSTQVEYGCWMAVGHDSDDEPTIQMSTIRSGVEFRPFSDFYKRKFVTYIFSPLGRWSEEGVEKVGARALDYISEIGVKIRVVDALRPSLSEDQKRYASNCIKAAEDDFFKYREVFVSIANLRQEFLTKWGAVRGDRPVGMEEDVRVMAMAMDSVSFGLYQAVQDFDKCMVSANIKI